MRRGHVNKRHSAHKFNRASRHMKGANIPRQPMRGGWRL